MAKLISPLNGLMGAMPQDQQQNGLNIEAARSNQMMAAAAPIDYNAVASPAWQKFRYIMDQRAGSGGGEVKNFQPPAQPLGHEDYANYAQQAMRGLQNAGPGSQDIFDTSRRQR